jgi:hypothetical protein
MRPISKKAALFCLLLTVWLAVGLAAHHHSSATDAARCSVCVAAHAAAPEAATTPSRVTFVSAFIQVSELVPAQQRLVSFALSVRPPPGV